MLVEIYVRDKLSPYLFHNRFFSCKRVNLCSFYRPISAMSLLKSPHNIHVWFGCVYLYSNGLLYGWD